MEEEWKCPPLKVSRTELSRGSSVMKKNQMGQYNQNSLNFKLQMVKSECEPRDK